MTGTTVFIDLRWAHRKVSIVTDEEAATRIGVSSLSTLFRGDYSKGSIRACSMEELYNMYLHELEESPKNRDYVEWFYEAVNELLEDNVIDEDCDTTFTVRNMLTFTDV